MTGCYVASLLGICRRRAKANKNMAPLQCDLHRRRFLLIEETGLSFHLESSLRAAGEGLTYGCPEGEPGWAVTRIAASEIRRLGLRILRDDKPHHLQVFGLAELRGTALRRMQRDIARRSAYVIPPRIG